MDDNNTRNQNKVPFDPGWNDPPTFSYNTQVSQQNKPRNILNKRVAFPLSNTNSPTVIPSITLPPPSQQPPSIPVSNPTLLNKEDDNQFNSESLLKEVKQVLIEFLDASAELGLKANDIKKRINVMEDMWNAGKLNKAVQLQMKNLAFALRDEQPNEADNIHTALMVDHINSVGTWMPGVKQLVHHCIAKSELLAIEKAEES